VAVRGSCGQAEIWSAGSKRQFTALKAAPSDQTVARGQARQAVSTSADGHARSSQQPAPPAGGSGPLPRYAMRAAANPSPPQRPANAIFTPHGVPRPPTPVAHVVRVCRPRAVCHAQRAGGRDCLRRASRGAAVRRRGYRAGPGAAQASRPPSRQILAACCAQCSPGKCPRVVKSRSATSSILSRSSPNLVLVLGSRPAVASAMSRSLTASASS